MCSLIKNLPVSTFLNAIKTRIAPQTGLVCTRGYAIEKKVKAAMSATTKKKVFPVESDPYKLVNYVCGSNIYKEGEDIKLKPESEYPDWLWTIHTGAPKTLDDVEKGTKEYWELVRKLHYEKERKLYSHHKTMGTLYKAPHYFKTKIEVTSKKFPKLGPKEHWFRN